VSAHTSTLAVALAYRCWIICTANI